MRISAKLRNYGPAATMSSVLDEARRAEAAGFDALWVSDHLVMPVASSSDYPYSADHKITWDLGEPWLEAVVVLAAVAATTTRVRVGTAVLIASLREPVHLAKQLACVEQLCPGRLALGVGDGWLREELEIFGVDFAERREVTDAILRRVCEVWAGDFTKDGSDLAFRVEPRPDQRPPILLGGNSQSVFRRIAQHRYGWLPLASGEAAVTMIRQGLDEIARYDDAHSAARPIVLNAGYARDITPYLTELSELGVEEVLVDAEFDEAKGPERVVTLMRNALPVGA